MKCFRNIIVVLIITSFVLCLSACGDPHKGQVEIFDGFNMVWITPAEGVDVNDLTREEFILDDNGQPEYIGENYVAVKGIDVSFYQGEIDWESVKNDGIEFVFIRCGFRGYEKGSLNIDERFEEYINGASEAGLDVGVYFFSQATSREEAEEEAEYVLDLINGYDITMPVVFDWEKIDSQENARTNDVEPTVVTEAAIGFCEKIKSAGYTPCVYCYRNTGYYVYDIAAIKDYVMWMSIPGDYPEFYYKFGIWQYNFSGHVEGVENDVDLDMIFIPILSEEKESGD